MISHRESAPNGDPTRPSIYASRQTRRRGTGERRPLQGRPQRLDKSSCCGPTTTTRLSKEGLTFISTKQTHCLSPPGGLNIYHDNSALFCVGLVCRRVSADCMKLKMAFSVSSSISPPFALSSMAPNPSYSSLDLSTNELQKRLNLKRNLRHFYCYRLINMHLCCLVNQPLTLPRPSINSSYPAFTCLRPVHYLCCRALSAYFLSSTASASGSPSQTVSSVSSPFPRR